MKRIKSENGAITILVLTSILFMVSFLISTYAIVANKLQTQKEIINEIRKTYEAKKSLEEIYNSYFDEDGIIPIYTAEQLLAIGTGKKLPINGKIYTFANDAVYLLKNDIVFNAYDISEDYYWRPIGYKTDNEEYVFEGNNYTITVNYLDEEENEYQKIYTADNSYGYLPSIYQKVEYIKSTGTEYIDTRN